jgi:hypothetical protein
MESQPDKNSKRRVIEDFVLVYRVFRDLICDISPEPEISMIQILDRSHGNPNDETKTKGL